MELVRSMGMTLLMFSCLLMGLCLAGGMPEKLYHNAVELGANSNFSKAKEALEQALGADPFFPPAIVCLKTIKDVRAHKIAAQTTIHIFKAMAYGNKAQWDEYIAEINRALEIDPKYARAYNHRGNGYHELGQYDRAIDDYGLSLQINPRSATAYFNRGITYRKKGELERAIADYNRCLKINPRFVQAYYSRGIAYRKKGELDQAITDFNHSIEINPRFAEAHFNKAIACEEVHRKEEALGAYKIFIQHAPSEYEGEIQFARERISILEKECRENLP